MFIWHNEGIMFRTQLKRPGEEQTESNTGENMTRYPQNTNITQNSPQCTKRGRDWNFKNKPNAAYETTNAQTITKTYLYNVDFLKPRFYIVKLEFTGIYIFFLTSAQKHILWALIRTTSARRF